MQIDPKGQDMLAVDASNTPPIFNRPPHVVCQLCRGKKVPVLIWIVECLGLMKTELVEMLRI
ncbi:hypothetical protein N7504_009903 [Penicillium tannophilum]|nr:hypothetical protein N7504_009903 [Penicillium tannophilum]